MRMRRDEFNKDETLDALDALGVKSVVVSFSGGNDSGGADEYEVMLRNGTVVSDINVAFPQMDRTEVDSLIEGIEAPCYQAYGSFAGDFYVSGKIVWDVENRTCKMQGDEEVKSYEPFEREF